MLSGHLQMHFTKIVIFIGGPPDSVSETKLYKTMKVHYSLGVLISMFNIYHFNEKTEFALNDFLVADSWLNSHEFI